VAVAGLGAAVLPARAVEEEMPIPAKPTGIPTMWVGAVTHESAVVKTRLPPRAEARLLVSAAGGEPLIFQPEPVADSKGTVRMFRPHGLAFATRYTCTLEVNGKPATYPPVKFRTFPTPGNAASFAFAFGSCARTGSEHEVFDTIRGRDPAFFLHLGDMHYVNISRDDPRYFRAAWDTVLASTTQGALYRSVPLAYVWDDHDFGPNDADGRSPSRAAARRVYREYAPHYPLPAGDGAIYQAFSFGRARFIMTDLRSERSPKKMPDGAGKTMLGARQKEWFKRELADASRSHAVVFWASSVPWIGGGEAGDGWQNYAAERKEIANFIAENGIRNLVILCGDAHMLAADDGTNGDYSDAGGLRIPVLHGSALDQRGRFKGGPYSAGYHVPEPGEGCFGWVSVSDSPDQVRVEFTGRDEYDFVKVRLKFAV
jgi:alkaline phosphatase D